MAEEILLDYVINRPNVPTNRPETELKVLLKVNASNAMRERGEEVVLPIHLAMVLDVSSSMKPREIDALKEAAKAAVGELRPGDFVSVIAFQSVVYEIVEPTRIQDSSTQASVQQKLDVIDQFQGGGTDMEYALTKGEHHLMSVPDSYNQVRKIMLFTDGQITGIPEACLKRAMEISARGIGIDCMGFGPEFDYKFMQRIASFSNGYTEKIDDPNEIARVFARRVKNVTDSVAKNVRLELSFTPQVRAQRGYRYSPEKGYMGKIRFPSPDSRTIAIPIGTLEKDKEYAYLVTLTVPGKEAGPNRVIKAELFYDIPALGIEGGASTQSVVIQYTDDAQAQSQITGEVERIYDEVEITRMVEQFEAAMNRGEKGQAGTVLNLIEERYRELGDDETAAHYAQLKQKYAAQGKLSLEDMNTARHKSTQKRESGVQLVDASSLI